jgi:hypothetical protein
MTQRSQWDPDRSSTYHLADGPVSVRWKRRSLTESSIMLLEEHHRWKGHDVIGGVISLPFLQTLVCLREVWWALQAMWGYAI